MSTEEDMNYLSGFVEGFTLKPFQELRREHVEIKRRIAAMELMARGNKQILLSLETGLQGAVEIESARLNEMKKTDERLTVLEERMRAIEGNGNGNGTKLSITDVQRLPPAVGVDEKKGLDALFDGMTMYRHTCTSKKCRHHLINRHASGVRCNKCGSAMESHPVVKRGARGKYKARQGGKA
jgi:hypothetical protein